jgi:uncharacterized membrane protein
VVFAAELGLLYASLCCISLGIGLAFYMQGVRLVLPFAFVELFAVGTAFVVYARHATDMERIQLLGSLLDVEIEDGGRLQRTQFPREWVQLDLPAGPKALIAVSAKGKTVDIGRHVRPELRPALMQEIRRALKA